MDLLSKKQRLYIVIAIVLVFIGIVALIVINNKPTQTDRKTQTSEIYDGPPITNVTGNGFNDFYNLITEKELGYLRYALGDFFHNKQGLEPLQNTVYINSSNQSYAPNQDIVIFVFNSPETQKSYNAKIIRQLTGTNQTRLIIEEYGFDVILTDYNVMQ